MSQNPKKSHRPKWIIFFAILILLFLGFLAHKGLKKQQIKNKLQSYRDQGLPATAAELETWHKYPPDDQNAALILIKATQQFVKWDPKPLPHDPNVEKMFPLLDPDTERSDTPPSDWAQKNWNLLPVIGAINVLPGDSLNPDTCIIVADFLNDNAAALNTLHQITNYSQSRMPVDYSLDIFAKFHETGSRYASQILTLETLLHLENQRPDLAVPSIISICRLAQINYQEPDHLYYQLGVSCSIIARHSLEYVLNRCPLNRTQLLEITAAFTDLQSAPGLSRFLIGERCLVSDAIYLNYWRSYLPNDWLDLYGPFLDGLGFIDDDHLLFLECMDRYDAALKSPVEQRLKIAQSINKEISELSNFHILIRSINIRINTFEMDILNHAWINSAQTALAIEHYRLDHDDQLPDSLTDLIPNYLEAIPIDPFDGLPIKYQKTNPGYLIYSVGPNLTDDHGTNYNPAAPTEIDIPFTVNRK